MTPGISARGSLHQWWWEEVKEEVSLLNALLQLKTLAMAIGICKETTVIGTSTITLASYLSEPTIASDTTMKEVLDLLVAPSMISATAEAADFSDLASMKVAASSKASLPLAIASIDQGRTSLASSLIASTKEESTPEMATTWFLVDLSMAERLPMASLTPWLNSFDYGFHH